MGSLTLLPPDILHFLLADIALSITCKELPTAQVTKLNILFQLLKSNMILLDALQNVCANEAKCEQ